MPPIYYLKNTEMKVKVWDTYVTRANGKVMHFDIIAPTLTEEELIHQYGKAYLASKNEASSTLTAEECQFCHIEQASAEMVAQIVDQGYYILEMQNCN